MARRSLMLRARSKWWSFTSRRGGLRSALDHGWTMDSGLPHLIGTSWAWAIRRSPFLECILCYQHHHGFSRAGTEEDEVRLYFEAANRIPNGFPNGDRQHQRRLADGFAAVDGVGLFGLGEEGDAEVGNIPNVGATPTSAARLLLPASVRMPSRVHATSIQRP